MFKTALLKNPGQEFSVHGEFWLVTLSFLNCYLNAHAKYVIIHVRLRSLFARVSKEDRNSGECNLSILKNSRVQINSKLKEKSRTLNSINDKLYLPGFARSRQDVVV